MDIRTLKAQKDAAGQWRATEDSGNRFKGTLDGADRLPTMSEVLTYWQQQGYTVARELDAGRELHVTLQRKPEPQTELEHFEAWRAENAAPAAPDNPAPEPEAAPEKPAPQLRHPVRL